MPEQDLTDWVEVASVKELTRRRKLKVDTAGGELVVIWHEGCPYALANVCVHQQRELVNGTILSGRVVCPGHQWAFDLETGYCRERDRYQPIHDACVDDEMVLVNQHPKMAPDLDPVD